MSKLTAILLALLVLGMFAVSTSADVGDVVICRDSNGSSTHSDSMGANKYIAQTFLATETGAVSGVKLPLTDNGVGGVFTVALYPTILSGSDIVPDVPGGILATTDSIDVDILPAALNTSADQIIECNTTDAPTQVFEFQTPAAITEGETYAILVSGGTSGLWNAELTAIIGDVYPSGEKWACEETIFDCLTDSNDWVVAGHGQGDESPFVIFGIIVVPETERNIDTWLVNFLEGMNLNSPGGKLLIGVGLVMLLTVTLMFLKTPMLFVAAFGAVGSLAVTVATLIDDALFLTMLALAGVAVLARLVIGIGASADD